MNAKELKKKLFINRKNGLLKVDNEIKQKAFDFSEG